MSESVLTRRTSVAGKDTERGGERTNRKDRPRAAGPVRQWWLDRSVRTKALVALTLPLLVAMTVQIADVALEPRRDELRSQTLEARRLLEDGDALLVDLGIAEAALSRYALTGDEQYLQPYESAVRRVRPEAAELGRGVEDDDVGVGAGDVTGPIHQALDGLARLREAAADSAVTPADVQAANQAVTPAFARLIEVRTALHRHVEEHVREVDRLSAFHSTLLLAGVGIALALGVLGAVLITRDVTWRVQALRANVDRFVQGERMQPIAPAGDEIGHLTDTLEGVGRVLRKSRDQLVASRDQAVEAARQKDEVLSRMSHELRRPLTAFADFGELLRMDQIGDAGTDDRESLDHIVKAGDHLLGLVNEVLDIAKIETGHLSLSVGPVEIAPLVAESLELVRDRAAGRNVTVTSLCAEGVDAVADRRRLKQVVLNLLSNAVKYNRHGGRVEVACDAGDETVRIRVTDTGMGISPAGLEHIFRPFDRIDTADTTMEGTSVGLALTKGLVEAMGGVIGVDSEVGRGSTFWVDLARAYEVEEPPPPVDAERSGERSGPAAGAPVLYVEDNLANLRLMERLFRDRPERLEVAVQGRRSLELARQLQPHLILLDLNLPDIDGTEALHLLKADPGTADIPVVIISADTNARRIEQLLDRGAAAYLTKPIDVLRLLDVLDTFSQPRAGDPVRRS